MSKRLKSCTTSQHQTNNATATDFAQSIQDNLNIAKFNLEQAIKRQKHYADQHRRELTFQLGDLVYLSTKHIQIQNHSCSKLKPRFIGPFKIIKVVSPVTYKLELPNSMLIHPVFHISLLKPHPEQSFVEQQSSNNNSLSQSPGLIPSPDSSPPVITSNSVPHYEVERVLGKRCRRNQIQYLVKWLNYPEHENSWEPEENLAEAQDAITHWEQRYQHRQTTQTDQTVLHRGRM